MMASLRSSTKFEADEDATILTEIGTISWSNDKLEANVKELLKSVTAVKPARTDGILL
jgi:ribosomal protein L1